MRIAVGADQAKVLHGFMRNLAGTGGRPGANLPTGDPHHALLLTEIEALERENYEG